MLNTHAITAHPRRSLSTVKGAAIAALVILAFVFFGGSVTLGAHPFWGMKIAYFAIAAGVLMSTLATLAGQRSQLQLVTFATLLVISIAVTLYGKTQFAASYAEDDVAGKLWFFGWIAGLAASFSIITALIAIRLNRNKPA